MFLYNADYYFGSHVNSLKNEDEKLVLNVALSAILKELKLIKEEKFTVQNNQVPKGCCILDGLWLSKSMDIELHINRTESRNLMVQQLNQNFALLSSILLHKDWVFKGEAPFENEGHPFIITAKNMKLEMVATFTGNCRILGNTGIITGIWMIGIKTNDWLDSFTAIKIIDDVLYKQDTEIADKVQQEEECITLCTETEATDKSCEENEPRTQCQSEKTVVNTTAFQDYETTISI